MSALYIIGNGFDIAHGLCTRYLNLRKFIEEKDPRFLSQFEEWYDIHPLDDTEYGCFDVTQEDWEETIDHVLWSEFEKNIGYPNTTSMLEYSNAATEGMPKYSIRSHMDIHWEKEFEYINDLPKYVKEWIESIDTNNIKPKKKSLINSLDYFLNFNYTDLLENVYEIENVLHIHGGVSSVSDIAPILGHCNLTDIQNHKQWSKESDEEFREAEASIQEAVCNYLTAIYKDTDEQIKFNLRFFNEIKSVEKIVIIGWSAGEVDIPYLRKIIESVSSNTKWEVYYYDDDAYNSLSKTFEHEGIYGDDHIKYLPSDEFWDE